VSALQVTGELHLIDGDKSRIGLARHRLDCTDPITRLRRGDLLLAGDQRHLVGANSGGDTRIYFARQQPERQADNPGFMAEHALDR
jgi:hypothetical protein